MLEVKNLHVSYGMIDAVKGIDFQVNDGEIVSLIGANGAGKTTTMHTLSGLLKAKEGTILLGGKDLTKVKANKIVGMGLVQVPEGRRVFTQMSVEENLQLGAYLRHDKSEIAKISGTSMNCFLVWKKERNSWLELCLAVSSRCWQWPEP